MKTISRFASSGRPSRQRGSVLMAALIFSLVLAIALVSYLQLSTNSLRLAHRTFFADYAGNLAETGLEEAVWSFNKMGITTDATTISNAWNGWTRSGVLSDVIVTCIGSNYTSAPTVSISGGGGSGATAIANIGTVYTVIGGVNTSITGVQSITLTNAGTGYTSAPTVTLSGGGGTGATAVARLAATGTFTFNNLDQNATGTVKVWVAGYDGATAAPIVVAKSIIQPYDGPPIEKYIEVVMSRTGPMPKGVIAKYTINWNGHPFADSFKSSTSAGVPPFSAYNPNTARANTTIASLYGPTVDLAHGTVNGNVMYGAGVTVTGGTINGQSVPNFTATITMPTYPTNAGGTGYYDVGSSVPSVLPRPADLAAGPASDGNYYYFVHGATIGSTSISTNRKVVIVGDGGTRMASGLMVQQGSSVSGGTTTYTCGSCTIYMDGPITLSGNDAVNTTSWAGALKVYTTTTSDCSFSGNASFYGCLTAPNAALVGNGSGNNAEDLCGSFIAKSVTSNGHMNFHYDEGLNLLVDGKPWSLAMWAELQTSDARAVYASKFNTF